jgi:hypothetical protein
VAPEASTQRHAFSVKVVISAMNSSMSMSATGIVAQIRFGSGCSVDQQMSSQALGQDAPR